LGSQLVLVDGPPGIGCPVIASVAGADYALAVTEPTPAAMNSLDRMLTVLSHFNIPTSIVMNRFDLNREYADKVQANGYYTGSTGLNSDPESLNRYLKDHESGLQKLVFKVYVPRGFGKMGKTTYPNLEETSDPAKIFTAVFPGEKWEI
jgi:cellulose biosynthesis protein BcsQ